MSYDADEAEPAYAERGMRARSEKDREPVSTLVDQLDDELSALTEQLEAHLRLIGPALRPEEAEDSVRGDLARIRINSPLAERLASLRHRLREARLTLGRATERVDL